MLKEMTSDFTEALKLIKESENFSRMTRSERTDYIKKIQELNEKIKNDPNLREKLSKVYPITDAKGNYTGTYLKILIGWAAMYNAVDNIINYIDPKEIEMNRLKLDQLKKEIESYYEEAISISGKEQKRKMKLGKENMQRFYNYGEAVATLAELKLKDQVVNEVLSKKENKYVFWSSTTEKGSKVVAEACEKVENELNLILSNETISKEQEQNIRKAISAVNEIKKIFS